MIAPPRPAASSLLTPNSIGLTTNQAPFIEQSRAKHELFIRQPYELYSEQNQETWRKLYARILPRWHRYGHPQFLNGVEKLAIDPLRIPKLEAINCFLAPLSGFAAQAVSGYVPAYIFFDSLRTRAFPTTITIRDGNNLDYLPEPDIFHDVAGHVPMHTDRIFSDILVRFGEVAQTAALRAKAHREDGRQLQRLESVIKAMARFFWFTIEFGLMGELDRPEHLKVYGSGLLSSFGELEHAVISKDVQRHVFRLEWVVNQYFEIDHYQPLLFVVKNFEQLYAEVDRLAVWIEEGKLDHVAPGEPVVNEADLRSFLA